MPHPRGDRFGGVVFDVQQFRKGEAMMPGSAQRDRLIFAISELIHVVEDMDEKLLHPEPIERVEPDGSLPLWQQARCTNTEHDRFGHRRLDCTECHPVCICKENDGRNGAPLCPVHEE